MRPKTENLERDAYAIQVAALRIACMLADDYTHRHGPVGVRLEAGPIEGWDDIVEVFPDGSEERWQVKRQTTSLSRASLLALLQQISVHDVRRATLALRTFVDVVDVGPMRSYLRVYERARRTHNPDDRARLAADLYTTEHPWVELLREAVGANATIEDALQLATRFRIEALGDPEHICADVERQLSLPLHDANRAVERLLSELHAAPDGILLHSPKTLREGILSTVAWRPELPPEAIRSPLPPTLHSLVGREATLATIDSALDTDGPLALHGLPGAGKSRLAAELSKRQHSRPIVWWIDGSSPTALVDGLLSLGSALGIAHAPSVSGPSLVADRNESRAQLERLHAHLQSTPHWWIVVDNAAPPAELWPLLPQGAGTLLLTTVHGDWASVMASIEVPPLKHSDSTEWLLDMTDETDRGAAETLAQRLGGLPLALSQACAFARHAFPAHGRLAAYLALYAETEAKLLDRGMPPDHPISLVASVSLVVERLSINAARTLTFLAALATAPVPLEQIAQQVNGTELHSTLAFLDDRLQLLSAIAELRAVALVAHHEEGLVTHQLVQSIVRYLTRAERVAIDSTVSVLVNRSFDRETGLHSSLNQVLTPHILHLCDNSVAIDGYETNLDLHILAGSYSMSVGRWTEAQLYFERASERSAKFEGRPRQMTLAWACFGLARISLLSDNIHESIAHGERSEEVLARHPDLAPALRVKNLKCLIDCNIRLGQHDEARVMVANLLTMLDLCDELWATEARAASYLAQAAMALAESDLTTALAKTESARSEVAGLHDHDPRGSGAHLIQLAQVQFDLGRYDAALGSYEEAHQILGPSGATFEASIAELGVGGCKLELGDLEGAITALKQSLLTLRQVHPNGRHLNIASAEHELGRAYLADGQPEVALQHCETALRLMREQLDNVEPRRIVSGLVELSRIYEALGDLPKSLESVDSALALYEAKHGHAPHLTQCHAWHQRAMVLMRIERYADAAPLLERTLEVESHLIGTTEQPSSARTRLLLAQAYLGMEQLDSAHSQAVRARRVLRKFLPKDHPERQQATMLVTVIETQRYQRQGTSTPALSSSAKTEPRSRNAPCSCGSGKKYKRCCASDARPAPNDPCHCDSGHKYKRCCGRRR